MTTSAIKLPGNYNLNQTAIVQVFDADTTLAPEDLSADCVGVGGVMGAVALCSANIQPRLGDRHRINARGGDVTVTGGPFAIVGGSFVPQGTSTEYELVVDSGGGLVWMALGSASSGFGEIFVKNIAALAALPTAGLRDEQEARVLTLDRPWELDTASTAAPDGITIVAAKNGGNWLAIEAFSKRWSIQLRSDGVPGFFIDAANGNDENDGTAQTQTPGTLVGPLKSNAEACRRHRQAQAGVNYLYTNVNDVPMQESTPRPYGQGGTFGPPGTPVLVSDRWRPSSVYETNPEIINPANGYETVFNFTLSGLPLLQSTRLLEGTFSAFTPTTGNVQQTVTGLGLQSYVGNLLVITNSTTTANIGAVATILNSTG